MNLVTESVDDLSSIVNNTFSCLMVMAPIILKFFLCLLE
jgi:hypothetical protein